MTVTTFQGSGAPRVRGVARVGADVVHVPELARRLAASPGLDAQLFTPGERQRAAGSAGSTRHLARAFAAKEALLKALGRGLNGAGPDGWLGQIELLEPGDGACTLVLGPAPRRALARRGLVASTAVGAAGDYALATVALLPQPPASAGSEGA